MARRQRGERPRGGSPGGARGAHQDVVIVGAGPAGIGLGGLFREFGIERFTILDRYEVGASFARWPREMRLITPSFTSNAFGLLDLNAVVPNTSPAYSLNREHPSGAEYADYLRRIASLYELPIRTGIEVQGVDRGEEGFVVRTSKGEIRTRFVVWAAGEFQYPATDPFPGAELCVHSSQVRTWSDVAGEPVTFIGGYESAADGAVALAMLNRSSLVLGDVPTWESEDPDPSVALSPYTRERLAWAVSAQKAVLQSGARITEVQCDGVGYRVRAADGREWRCDAKPVLATGFRGSTVLIDSMLDRDEDGHPLVTEEADESPSTPGLFLAGPLLRHRGVRFCFVYKYRQRFGIVAHAIAQRLGVDDSAAVEQAREEGFFLDDLSCCAEDCEC